jgi:tetratricopeptide (TPR) repeat protein
LKEDYFDNNGIYIGDVYNALIQRILDLPQQVARLAEAAVAVYLESGQDDEAILYLELQSRALLSDQRFDEAILLVERFANIEHDVSEQTVLELADDILGSQDSYGVSVDQRPLIMSKVTGLIQRYGQDEKVGNLYLDAACLNSSHGASQAAFRCIDDAEQIARSLPSLALEARCYLTTMIVACDKNDYKSGVEAGELATAAYLALGEELPASLLGNLGVAYMNLDDNSKAIRCIEQALANDGCASAMKITLYANLSVCFRRCNRLDEAESVLATAETIITSDENNTDGMLEYR